MNFAKRLMATLGIIAVAAGIGTVAARSEFPEKPIKMLVGFGAGGGTDLYARNIARFLQAPLDTQVVVVNKPGAAGMVAAKDLKDAGPDGYTLLTAGPGNFIIKAVTDGEKARVFPLKEFRPLGGIGELVTSIIVPKDSPFSSAGELVEYARANPGKLRWSHSGRGSFHTIGGMLFLKQNGVKAQDVPFNTGGAARQALVAKQVDFAFLGIQQLDGFEETLRAVGVTTAARDPLHGDIPTFADQGLPQMSVSNPIIVYARADIPDDAAATLSAAIEAVASTDEFRDTLAKAGITGFYLSAEDAKRRIDELDAHLTPVVQEVFAK